MAASTVKVQVRLDKRALDEQLTGRTGPVTRTLSGFAGLATQEIRGVFRERAGGVWWRTESTIEDAGSRGTVLRVITRKSKAHRIVARNAPVLVFSFADGTTFVGQSVNHPGSTPPVELVLLGIERAGRRLTFTRAAPRVTTNP